MGERGRPGKDAGERIERGAGGQAGGGEAHGVAIGIEGGEGEGERDVFRSGAVTDGEEHRRGIGSAHGEGEHATGGERIGRETIAAIGDLERDVPGADVSGGRRPAELGLAVDTEAGESRSGREIGGGPGKRILVEIGRVDREDERLAHECNAGGDHGEIRGGVGRGRGENKTADGAEHGGGVAIAIIAGEEGHDEVATQAGIGGRKGEKPGVVAQIGEGCPGRQTVSSELENATIAVGGGNGERPG